MITILGCYESYDRPYRRMAFNSEPEDPMGGQWASKKKKVYNIILGYIFPVSSRRQVVIWKSKNTNIYFDF